jgi:hypothetical protein
VTRDELDRLLEGTAADDEKKRLAQALAAPNEDTRATLGREWAAPRGPDVFDAAFEVVHAPAPPWWKRLVLPVSVAAALAVVGVVMLEGGGAPDGVKGVQATPTLGLVLVTLDGAPRRVADGEVVPVGARLGARVTVSQPAWLALEELRDDGWARVWPDDVRGVRLEGGEHELGDVAGAVVLRVEPRAEPWRLRMVGSVVPLDADGARSELTTSIVVGP